MFVVEQGMSRCDSGHVFIYSQSSEAMLSVAEPGKEKLIIAKKSEESCQHITLATVFITIVIT